MVDEALVRALRESAVLLRLEADDFDRCAERCEAGEMTSAEVFEATADTIMKTTVAIANSMATQ
jgi:hypothetical protein